MKNCRQTMWGIIDIGWKLDSRNYEWCKYHGGELFDKCQKVEWWQFLPETLHIHNLIYF